MATRNYYQAKRQKEISRKTRQDKKQQKKLERAVDPNQPGATDAADSTGHASEHPVDSTT